jgi:hypothetical protein
MIGIRFFRFAAFHAAGKQEKKDQTKKNREYSFHENPPMKCGIGHENKKNGEREVWFLSKVLMRDWYYLLRFNPDPRLFRLS